MNNFYPIDCVMLRMFRKLFALILAGNMLMLAPNFEPLYGTAGWIDVALLRIPQSFPVLGIQNAIHYLQCAGLSASHAAWFIITGYIALCFCLAFNYFWRTSAVLLLILDVSIFNINEAFSYGADAIRASLLFYLIFLPQQPGFYLWLYIRVVQTHLCMIYFFSGLVKAMGDSWWNGEAIWKAANLPYFHFNTGWHLDLLANQPWLAVVIGWFIILLEQFYPIAMCGKRIRTLWLGAICVMHAVIAYFMGLWHFSMLMISWNVGAFWLGSMILQKYYLKINLKLNPSRWWRGQDAQTQKPVA